jgi:thiol-disulfide isomerase/thioredoxin
VANKTISIPFGQLTGKLHFCNVFKTGIALFISICSPGFIFLPAQQPSDEPQKAPGFTAIAMSGDTVSLAQYRGNLVLLDFWASWNQPSRKHNRATVKLYEKYRALSLRKKRKFVVLQVSLDEREDFWRTAITKDNLYWRTHICDFKGWNSPFVSLYNFRRIPTNVLIDTAGNIVGRDLWEERLDSALNVLMR